MFVCMTVFLSCFVVPRQGITVLAFMSKYINFACIIKINFLFLHYMVSVSLSKTLCQKFLWTSGYLKTFISFCEHP